jgi:hypothetical protein
MRPLGKYIRRWENNIVTCQVTIDGVWIGNRIYCTLTTRNYSIYTLQLTTTEFLWTLSVSQVTTNSAESLARAQDLLQIHFTISELSTQTALPVAF